MIRTTTVLFFRGFGSSQKSPPTCLRGMAVTILSRYDTHFPRGPVTYIPGIYNTGPRIVFFGVFPNNTNKTRLLFCGFGRSQSSSTSWRGTAVTVLSRYDTRFPRGSVIFIPGIYDTGPIIVFFGVFPNNTNKTRLFFRGFGRSQSSSPSCAEWRLLSCHATIRSFHAVLFVVSACCIYIPHRPQNCFFPGCSQSLELSVLRNILIASCT